VKVVEVMEVEVARKCLAAERVVMLRRVSKSMIAALEMIKPAGMIKVERMKQEEEVRSGLVYSRVRSGLSTWLAQIGGWEGMAQESLQRC
jgi:hypothetical protein